MSQKKPDNKDTPTPRMKKPFEPRRTRSRASIDELVGPMDESIGPTDLGNAFLAATSVRGIPEENPKNTKADDAYIKPNEFLESKNHDELSHSTASSSHSDTSEFEALIPVSKIQENAKLQPRLCINEEHVLSLAEKFDQYGQMNAIIVRPVDDSNDSMYEIIGGNHRFRAAKHLQWESVRCHVKNITFSEAQILAIDDNDSNLPTSDYERALAYQRLLDSNAVPNQSALAKSLGISRARVSQCLSFTALPKEVLAVLDKKPDLFNYVIAIELRDLIKELTPEGEEPNSKLIEYMTKGVSRALNGSPVTGIASWVKGKFIGRTPFKPKDDSLVFSNKGGKVVFKTKIQNDSIIFDLGKETSPDKVEIQKYLSEALMNFPKINQESSD